MLLESNIPLGFIVWTAEYLGIQITFKGNGTNEVGVVVSISGDLAPDIEVGQALIRIDPRYFRPSEVDTLLGDASLAKKELTWEPKISAKEMCIEMIKEDYKSAQRSFILKEHGLDLPVSLEN